MRQALRAGRAEQRLQPVPWPSSPGTAGAAPSAGGGRGAFGRGGPRTFGRVETGGVQRDPFDDRGQRRLGRPELGQLGSDPVVVALERGPARPTSTRAFVRVLSSATGRPHPMISLGDGIRHRTIAASTGARRLAGRPGDGPRSAARVVRTTPDGLETSSNASAGLESSAQLPNLDGFRFRHADTVIVTSEGERSSTGSMCGRPLRDVGRVAPRGIHRSRRANYVFEYFRQRGE